MKKIVLIITIIGILGASAWAIYSQSSSEQIGVFGSLLKDKTDPLAEQPITREVIPLFHLERKWECKKFRVQTISNYACNKVLAVALPARVMVISNPGERDKEVGAFAQEVSDAVDSINGEEIGLPQSSIYTPIVQEANIVASSGASQMFVVAYTNCEENTPFFSIYKPKDRVTLKKNPEKIKRLLKSKMAPGNLNGVSVYIIYRPNTDINYENFSLMSNIFKQILEESGAKVYIGANLIPNNNEML